MIRKYKKRPVVVEALQYDGFHTGELNEFVGESLREPVGGNPYIMTLEGAMEISPGDYVIKGVRGEFYPIKPDIFDQTYDLVEGEKEVCGVNGLACIRCDPGPCGSRRK